MHILGELDVKGTGDIEFDEFIYFMTRPQVGWRHNPKLGWLKPRLTNYLFQNLEKMLTADDRKHIEKHTGVAMNNENSKYDSF